ncbi:hypothetical protein [Paenibacillus dokdonensis]|uniref:hypothetical protein n=1 Tax=Paenibacillus dokdonensis TaxID=2567944 RepID=UPI0010A76026|nr:hypothetical protein [Paenibacillus dokdonensis]
MKDFFKHPIVAGTITAFITLAITTPIVAYTRSISFSKSLKAIWDWIVETLTFGIPLWIILLIIVIILTARRIFRSSPESKPEFLNYTNDVIEGIKWEWSFYTYGGKYDFNANTPIPICKNCNGYLVLDYDDYHNLKLRCENCTYKKQLSEWEFSDYQNKIKREIMRRIRTNSWKKESI